MICTSEPATIYSLVVNSTALLWQWRDKLSLLAKRIRFDQL